VQVEFLVAPGEASAHTLRIGAASLVLDIHAPTRPTKAGWIVQIDIGVDRRIVAARIVIFDGHA
jgi:hypothetical protein